MAYSQSAHHHQPIDTLIFDIGDVLFTWSAETKTSISPKKLKEILNTVTWFEYEKGKLTEDECYAAVAEQMNLDASEIRRAFQGARDSLTSRQFMVDLIRELKPGRKVYAMSNISAPDWEVLRAKPSDWDVFDGIFTSAAAGERKPNMGFYRQVLEKTGADPRRTVFVDDKLDNVLSARSLGITGIVYDDFATVERALRNACGNPVVRGQEFLRKHAKRHTSFTNNGHTIEENFAQLLILEATGDSSLVEYTEYDGPFNFFRGEGQLTTRDFPYDADTTSIGLTIAPHVTSATKHRVMDQILGLRSSDKLLQVYFDPTRPRIDPIVCVNVLTFFHSNGRGQELAETFDWVESVLEHRAYLDGTRYYETAEAFLFFLSRLLEVSPMARSRLGKLYADRCRERLNVKGDALALAMRVIFCARAGVDASRDLEKLLEMQEVDGGWPDGWFYKYGSNGVLIANRGFTTALAIQAIQCGGRKSVVSAAPAPTAITTPSEKRVPAAQVWDTRPTKAVPAHILSSINWALPILGFSAGVVAVQFFGDIIAGAHII